MLPLTANLPKLNHSFACIAAPKGEQKYDISPGPMTSEIGTALCFSCCLCHKLSKKDRSDTAQTISRAPSILATHVTIVPRTRMHRHRHICWEVHISIQRACRMGENRLQCHRKGPGAVHSLAFGSHTLNRRPA